MAGEREKTSPAPGRLRRAGRYVATHYWEVPANVLETIAVVLVVFVQDLAFKESVVMTAALLTVSFCLHGLGYRAGQCQVWPKLIEIAAPLLFYCLIPPAFLVPHIAQRTAFIIINFWFVAVQLGSILCGRNFIREYYYDLNPRAIWDTPLIERCSIVVGLNWVVCQAIMGLAQVFVVAFNISMETDVLAAVMMCYVMQLLPVLWAATFTFVYPWYLKRKWGYVKGVRETCYPPQTHPAVAAVAGGAGGSVRGGEDVDGDQDQELVIDARYGAAGSSTTTTTTCSGGSSTSKSSRGISRLGQPQFALGDSGSSSSTTTTTNGNNSSGGGDGGGVNKTSEEHRIEIPHQQQLQLQQLQS